ncbi:MAG: bifunctional demethylmenaquinone methyltransferase/2-methoxy-6-polyprenyl-1,4-benzoquinol methylase UbiE [Bacteroidales bacterium]|nr:bifunctional demethylmenaquinone methyltransferase/2-methoxy-6-polyprenyl-1,4-benzoquinol methylase UbiE [Bacteroidales bacterium]
MEEKQHIGKLFDRIAGTYDRLNHILSLNVDRRWRRRAVKGMSPCTTVLDVAVGTADLAIELIRQGKASRVVGIDLSLEMMRIGREKVERQRMSDRITFREGSALQLPYEDNSFDAVTCAFGVRNFSDLELGLDEMRRVLKPGGQLMVLEFSYPRNKMVAWLYDLYFSHILPAVGRFLSKDKTAYTYLNKSVKNFIWGEKMTAKLTETGFRVPRFTTYSYGIASVYRATK